MNKIFSLAIAALLGIALGYVIFSSFMVIEVSGSKMLPEFEPGSKVLVNLLTEADDYKSGDVVVFTSPYYMVDGESQYIIRRVTENKGKGLKIKCDCENPSDEAKSAGRSGLVNGEDVIGRVLLKF